MIAQAKCDRDCLPRGGRHRCHEEGCERRIPREHIACKRHWNKADPQLRDALRKERGAT